jgi:hypothetical protein
MDRKFDENEYLKPISGKEFRESGGLFIINQLLHAFGMAISWNPDTDELKANITKFRGFGENEMNNGYLKITQYMIENAKELEKDLD